MKDESNFGKPGQLGGGDLTCADFDRLLADALDGVMAGQELAEFKAHAEACADCGPLFTQAHAGMSWMKSLVEVEAPGHLFHNILAKTSMAQAVRRVPGASPSASWLERATAWVSPGLRPAFATAMQPRFAMTAAMAFFSVSMLLNLAGLKLKDFRYIDLRPSAITTTASVGYHETTAKVVKYYENIRLVYELESRMKALKDAAAENSGDSSGNPPAQQQPKQRPDDSSSQEHKQNKNEEHQYVSEKRQIIMAMLRMSDGARISQPLNAHRRDL